MKKTSLYIGTVLAGIMGAIGVHAVNTPTAYAPLAGKFLLMPNKCSAGALFTAIDQPLGQQLYICGGGNTWFQLGTVGKSGGLLISRGSIDINPAVIPTMQSGNTFLATQTMANGMSLNTENKRPDCSADTPGVFWFLNNHTASKDSVQVCAYTGSAYSWIKLY